MQNFEHTDIYFRCTYGLATMPLDFRIMKGQKENVTLTQLIGHAGEDWGSTAEYCGYNFGYDFSFAVTQGSYLGMNCTLQGKNWTSNFMIGDYYPCAVYN